MNSRLHDPDTWKSLWEAALNDAARCQKKADAPESIERWNSRAHEFAEIALSPGAQDSQKWLLDALEKNGALKEGFRVLDVGAGSGRYTIPLAKMGCEVVALEPAEAMALHIRERMEQENVPNITILNKTWQAVDLAKDNMLKQFDLVFASMTPGIQRPDDILKMIKASRHACYLSSHTRDRWYRLENVWKDIFGQEMPDMPGDFIYRYGFVYALGYQPLTFCHKAIGGQKRARPSHEKLKEDILWWLSSYIGENEMTGELNAKIDAYARSVDLDKEVDAGRSMASQAMLWFVSAE